MYVRGDIALVGWLYMVGVFVFCVVTFGVTSRPESKRCKALSVSDCLSLVKISVMMLEISIMFHNIFLDSPRGLDFFTGRTFRYTSSICL
jgi:hypothetical protein